MRDFTHVFSIIGVQQFLNLIRTSRDRRVNDLQNIKKDMDQSVRPLVIVFAWAGLELELE